MKKILVLVFSNLKHDARVTRQINFLKKNYLVTVVCFDSDDIDEVEIIRIKKTNLTLLRKALSGIFLLLKFHMAGYWLIHDYGFLKKQLRTRQFDLVIANDVEALPLAFQLKGTAKVLFDAHEYAPRHFENNLMWRIFFKGMNNYLCKKYIPQVAAMTTVGRGLAEEYEKHFNVKPTVITNASPYYDVNPTDIQANKIRLIHHGIANASRRLELMIEMMKHLDDRFSLDLMLMIPPIASSKTQNYLSHLQTLIGDDRRINIIPPVKSVEIVKTINKYDVGVFLIPPINFNYANTLPNKLFDFIQARLAIAIGPTPEMAEIVNRFNNGVVAEDFTPEKLAQKISTLNPEILTTYKHNSALAAVELNAEKNEVILNNLVEKVLHGK